MPVNNGKGKSKGKGPVVQQTGNLTNNQRKAICEHWTKVPKISQTKLAEWAKLRFNLSKTPTQATISNIIKKRDQYLDMDEHNLQAKRARDTHFPELDAALANWVLQCQGNRININGDLIKAKASVFAEKLNIPLDDRPVFSNGWLDKFKDRHGFRLFKSHGESGSVDNTALNESLPNLLQITDQYNLKDIFNMDETGLFYRMAPDTTIAARQIEGSKKDKTRLTIAFGANADGSEKLQPFFIGHANKPRAFKKKSGEELGFYYRSNTKAWMTGLFFQEWLKRFDCSMKNSNRKCLLLLDNAPSHISGDLELGNVRVVMLPPNSTSKIQPMDAGIIAAFKKRYRRSQLYRALDLEEAGSDDIYKVDQLQAMKWAVAAWNDISSTTISNCWKHCQILHPRDINGEPITGGIRESAIIQDPIEMIIEEELVQQINTLAKHPMSLENLLNPAIESQVHQIFSDDEIVEMAIQVEEEADDVEPEVIKPELTAQQKLSSIRDVIAVLEEDPDKYNSFIQDLRKVQFKIRDGERQREQNLLVQNTLTFYFK